MRFSRTAAVAAFAAGLLSLGACAGDSVAPTPSPNGAALSLGLGGGVTSTTLAVGSTVQLTAQLATNGHNNLFTRWSSSNTQVATVTSSGFVTAMSPGSTVIIATNGQGADTATVIVSSGPAATPGGSSLTLAVGGTAQLSSANLPTNGHSYLTTTWSSSQISVATVSPDGLVTAVAPGTATIVVTNGQGSATTAVTVNGSTSGTPATPGPGPSGDTIAVGATKQLSSAGLATNGHNTLPTTWSSAQNGVATVSSSGVVTGVAPGTASITASTLSECWFIENATFRPSLDTDGSRARAPVVSRVVCPVRASQRNTSW